MIIQLRLPFFNYFINFTFYEDKNKIMKKYQKKFIAGLIMFDETDSVIKKTIRIKKGK